VLINDEKTTLAKLNRLCGANNNVFLGTIIPRQRNLVVVPEVNKNRKEVFEEGGATQRKFGNEMSTTKSKILTHFLNGKISFTPLEKFLIILGELQYLEGLVKLAKRWKDEEAQQVIHIFVVTTIPTIKHVSVNKNYRDKTLHLTMEVQNGLIEGLVDMGASMLMMATWIIQKLGIMHLVSDNENYKMTSSIVTRTLGRIINLPIKVRNIQCNMVFLIIDIDIYDVLLGLDFLMKIEVRVDVEKGVIQV